MGKQAELIGSSKNYSSTPNQVDDDLRANGPVEEKHLSAGKPETNTESNKEKPKRFGLSGIQNVAESSLMHSTVDKTGNNSNLFRLSIKKGEYVYARPSDIIMIESCDHLVRVYVSIEGKLKKTMHNTTLKDFLLRLPQSQFVRIGRFCAINMHRISGGNYNEQVFEFDFKTTIKLTHAVPHTVFSGIGK